MMNNTQWVRSLCQPALGFFQGIPSPEISEMAALVGLDFLVLDGEHGRIQPQAIHPLLTAAKAANPALKVFYRLPDQSPASALQAVDQGIDGIIIPQVSTPEQLKNIVEAAKFAPIGNRGVHPAVRAAQYGLRSQSDYLSGSNFEQLIVAQIEGMTALNNFKGILASEGLDAIFVGPYDLSQSLGIPGQVEHASVKSALQQIAEEAKAVGLPLGTFAGNENQQLGSRELGYKLIAISIDTLCLAKAIQSLVQAARKQLGPGC